MIKRGFASYFLVRTGDSNVGKDSTGKYAVSLVESDCNIVVEVCLGLAVAAASGGVAVLGRRGAEHGGGVSRGGAGLKGDIIGEVLHRGAHRGDGVLRSGGGVFLKKLIFGNDGLDLVDMECSW